MLYRVMFLVFQERFIKGFAALKGSGKKEPTPEQVAALVRDSIVLLLWIMGNHDEWMLENGWTPLMMATESYDAGRTDVARFLIEKGANPNLQTGYGTPLENAIKHGNAEMIEILRGQKPDAR